jgi:hypothetical protein
MPACPPPPGSRNSSLIPKIAFAQHHRRPLSQGLIDTCVRTRRALGGGYARLRPQSGSGWQSAALVQAFSAMHCWLATCVARL